MQPKARHRRQPGVGAGVVGALAGFLSGLFGVGGGILIVPGLVGLLRFPQRLAHGTSLAAIVPIALSGVVGYAVNRSVDWPAAGLIPAGAAAGAVLGTRWLRFLPQRTLRLAFLAFLLATAARMVVDIPQATGRSGLDAAMALGMVLVGVVSGTLAGLLGVGGGIVIVPALVLLFSVPDAVAKGTSLAVIIPTALVGTARNVRHANASLPVAAVVGLLGVASAFGAAQLSVGLSPRVSGLSFAALLVAVAAHMAYRTWRAAGTEPRELPIGPAGSAGG